ncbi:MAG: acyl-CoA dehydratase activase [Candidatus Heimdallarchaeota archaeon]
MNYVAGLDVGSLTAKIVVLGVTSKEPDLCYQKILRVGYNPARIARQMLEEAESFIGQSFQTVISTGYGRKLVENATRQVTEITCHATGAHYTNQNIRTIIDIGGQDSKVIKINGQGKVQDFTMNEKCAAGTGRFIEVMANALEVDLENFGTIAIQSTNPTSISNTCTVFAESEIISKINQGISRIDVIAGICQAIAKKIGTYAARVGIEPVVALTGGVAHNSGVRFMLEAQIKKTIEIPDSPGPQMIGALGAALIAAKVGE